MSATRSPINGTLIARLLIRSVEGEQRTLGRNERAKPSDRTVGLGSLRVIYFSRFFLSVGFGFYERQRLLATEEERSYEWVLESPSFVRQQGAGHVLAAFASDVGLPCSVALRLCGASFCRLCFRPLKALSLSLSLSLCLRSLSCARDFHFEMRASFRPSDIPR